MSSRVPAIVLAVAGLLLVGPLLAAAVVPGPASLAAPGSQLRDASQASPPQSTAASLSLGLTTPTPMADPADTVVFSLFYNNTGNQSAPDAWINVSASSSLIFQGDTAVGNVSGFPRYHFTAVTLGLHAFQLSFLVAIGTAPGALATLSSTLVYSDGAGALHFLGPAQASVLVGVVTKPLYLGWSTSPAGILTPAPPTGGLLPQGTFTLTKGGPAVAFDLVPALARSFRALNVTAVLYVEPIAPATLDMNVTLIDVNGAATTAVASVEQTNSITGPGYWTLFYTFPAMNYLFSQGHQIRLQVLNTANSGNSALLATNATAEPSRTVFQTTTYVTVTSLTPRSSPPTYLSPKSTLVVTANVSDPFGSGEIVDARLNLTGPSGPLVTWLSLLPAAAVDASSPSAWKVFQYTRPPLLANGSYSIRLTAIERNGVVDIAASSFTVRAPSFTLQKVSSVAQSKSGGKFTYSLWYNNTGTGPAGTVWVNDTLPSQVNFQSSLPAFSSNSGSTYGWVLTNIAVGSHVILITVLVKGGVSGVAYIRNWASLNFTDEHGFPWSPLVSHADVVLNGPFISLGATTSPVGFVHSNQSAVDTLTLTNTGDAANTLWLNVTLPSGLAYVSDTASSLGGTRTVAGNRIAFVFTNMPSGTSIPVSWVFTLTVRAGSGLPWGGDLTSRVTLNDTSGNNVLMPEEVLNVPLTVAAPAITAAAIRFGSTFATPEAPLLAYVNFTNGGNELAPYVWINLTLDPFLYDPQSPFLVSPGGTSVGLLVTNASVGADSAVLQVTPRPNVSDRQVLSLSGNLVAADGFGNVLAPLPAVPGSVAVALPAMNFTLSPASRPAEAGTALQYTIAGGNTGSGTASSVWLNASLPPSVAYDSDSFGVTPVVVGSTYSWRWTNYVPGTHTYLLNLTASGSAQDHTAADLLFTVEALDLGGHLRPPVALQGQVQFLAPAWLLSITADHTTNPPGGICNYTLRAQNVGSTPARYLWLLLALNPNVELITHTAPVPATGTSTLNWTFQDVQPGQSITFNVLVKVKAGTPANTPIVEYLGAYYTNSAGTVLGYARSPAAQVDVQADLMPLVYILVLGSAAGAGIVFLAYRRYRVQIEDVFLIYRDGILVSHLTNTTSQGKDEDSLSGMLTAVQDFVQDAFTYGEHRDLHELEFGDYHILIERGGFVYLAVVYQGRDSGLIRKKVRTVLEKIETKYATVFETWDGNMDAVEGTRDMLREGFVDEDHPWSLVKPKVL